MNVVQIVDYKNDEGPVLCEYGCSNVTNIYMFLDESILNPMMICQECAKKHTIIDWCSFNEYKQRLNELRNNK